MIRLNGDTVEPVTDAEVEAMFRTLKAAADAVNSVRDGTDKYAACQQVFGRDASAALEAAQLLR